MSSLMHSYGRIPITPVKGSGAWLWDENGNTYLDALSGIAVTSLGHCNPAITERLCEQASTLIHTSNLYHINTQETLAAELCEKAKMDRAFFCNSGAEANEAAIKIARLYAHSRNISAPQIVVTEGAFHGRTLATLTATGNRKIQAGFEPLVQGFVRAPYNDTDALRQIAENSKNVVALMVEPVQGEGGIVIPDSGYLTEVREICNEYGWLLIFDEIQTGMGRTGAWFAWQHEGAKPDVMTSAKALGNGFPIGACLASGPTAELITPGSHGTTFGGNQLACAVASIVIDEIERNNLIDRVNELSERISNGLKAKLNGIEAVKEIRAKGLMLAVELDRNCSSLMQTGAENGILLNVTAENNIRLLPPFILSDEDADLISEKVSQLIIDFVKS